jgi:hypothetical protein
VPQGRGRRGRDPRRLQADRRGDGKPVRPRGGRGTPSSRWCASKAKGSRAARIIRPRCACSTKDSTSTATSSPESGARAGAAARLRRHDRAFPSRTPRRRCPMRKCARSCSGSWKSRPTVS